MASQENVIDYASEYGVLLETVPTVLLAMANAWVANQIDGATVNAAQRLNAESAYTLHLMSAMPQRLSAVDEGSVEAVTFGPIKVSLASSSSALSSSDAEKWLELAILHLKMAGLSWLITVVTTR
jgi:hypothetical protein